MRTIESPHVASELVSVPTDIDDFFEFAMARGWSDGLPLIPPTRERVERMLEANPSLDPAEVVAVIPPRKGLATVELVAVNAVMAGCLPEFLPVLVTAVRAVSQPAFGLRGVQSTTHPVAPLIIMHGRVVERIGANYSYGLYGPGNRTNATIGRAMRLVQQNIGGARPNDGDQSGQGSPSKYVYCIAENSVESPWPTFQVRRGFDAEQSAVTVFPGAGPENVNDHVSGTALGILTTMADQAGTMGGNNTYVTSGDLLCVINPEHAKIIADDGGWMPEDVSRYLYEHARRPLGQLKMGGMYGMGTWPAWMNVETDDSRMMPVVETPDDFLILVAGGRTKHSTVVKNFSHSRSVTMAVPDQDLFST